MIPGLDGLAHTEDDAFINVAIRHVTGSLRGSRDAGRNPARME